MEVSLWKAKRMLQGHHIRGPHSCPHPQGLGSQPPQCASPWPPSSAPWLGPPPPAQPEPLLSARLATLGLTLALTPRSPELSLSCMCSHRLLPPPLARPHQQAPRACMTVPVPCLQTSPPKPPWPGCLGQSPSGQGPGSSPAPRCSPSQGWLDHLQVSGHQLLLKPPGRGPLGTLCQ